VLDAPAPQQSESVSVPDSGDLASTAGYIRTISEPDEDEPAHVAGCKMRGLDRNKLTRRMDKTLTKIFKKSDENN